MFDFYEVGGKVRDELMGLQSKDIDYVAVPHKYLLDSHMDANIVFKMLVEYLDREKFEMFLITPNCFTIRAKFPKGHQHERTVADFVMARKELGYREGTREPTVVPGTLRDDLERRDFTVNAIAKDKNGTLIDPFNGIQDIKDKVLRTPLSIEKSFNDDPLRILRAIRFMITKGFLLNGDMYTAISTFDYKNKMKVVSEERIREELYKMFKHDTAASLALLTDFPKLLLYIFDTTKLWLKPTNEK